MAAAASAQVADLSISIQGPVSPVPVGSNAVFTLTVSNQGPNQAVSLQIVNTFSSVVSVTNISASGGSWTNNFLGLVWSLPSLNAGGLASLVYTVTNGQPAVVTVTATVSSATSDPVPQNNTAVDVLVIGPPPPVDGVTILQIPANDIVWSHTLGRLLFSAGTGIPNWGGGLVSLDPVSLTAQYQAQLGTNGGRLAISSDETVLYAAADLGVDTVQLPACTVSNTFPVAGDSARYVVDMQVQPGNDGVIAIETKTHNYNASWLAAYSNGVQLANLDFEYTPGLSLVFGSDPAVLYAQDFGGGGFRRYSLGPQGLTLIDANGSVLPMYTAMELVGGNSWLFASTGNVINPVSETKIGIIAGIAAGSGVCYDAGENRVFYLTPQGNQGLLQAFDGPTLLPVGSRIVPGVSGSLNRFIRWGADGFAAVTSAGQVVLFESSLVATNPPADVSVSLAAMPPPPYLAGSNLSTTITISNAGPNPATAVAWTNILPFGASNVTAYSSDSAITVSSNMVSGSIPLLATGMTATVNVAFTLPAGMATNEVAAVASSIDPNFANNSAAALWWIQPSNNPPAVAVANLAVNYLERDPVRPRLYASFSSSAGAVANCVAAIDPVSGNIGSPVYVGSNPDRLAASANGQFLYVALDGAGSVEKLSLPGLAPVGSFMIPNGGTAARMVVCPTNADMVAIRRSPDNVTSLQINGVELPNELSAQDLMAFLDTTGQLFGCDSFHSDVPLYQLDTGPDGLALLASQPGKPSIPSSDLKSSGGLFFYNGGMVVDPVSTRVRAQMPVPYNSLVEPDAASGRVFYLAPAGSTWTLEAFDISQGIQIGAVSLPSTAGTPQRLLRWGTNGLAYYTSGSQLVFLQGQLVPTNPPTEVALTQTLGAISIATNVPFTNWLVVTNSGPGIAPDVVVTQTYSSAVGVVSFAGSNGVATFTNGATTWSVGDLAPGAVASLAVSLNALQTGPLTVSAVASHGVNDVFWGNNVAFGAVNVAGPTGTNVTQVQLSARDIAYDSARNMIYASTPASDGPGGNLIVAIDPATGAMRGAYPGGSEPDRIAISDDNGYLYVGVDGEMGVRRINLSSNMTDLDFPLGSDLYHAEDIKVPAGEPETIGATLASYNLAAPYPSSVVVYDHGQPRPRSGGNSVHLEFSADGSWLFGYVAPGQGYGFLQMRVDASGITTNNVFQAFSTDTGDLRFGNGRLFTSSGQILDPFVPATITNLSVSGALALDEPGGTVYYLSVGSTNWQISAFDTGTFQFLGSQAIAGATGSPVKMIRCGGDLLAFLTSSSQLFIVHGGADLSLHGSISTNEIVAGGTLSLQLTVSNAGPYAVTSASITNHLPPGVNVLSAVISQGSLATNANGIVGSLGAIATNGTATLTFVLSPSGTVTGPVTDSAGVGASDLSDPIPVNNYASQQFTIDLPAMTRITGPTNGVIQLGIHGAVGQTYDIEISTDLRTWSVLTNFQCQTDGQYIAIPWYSNTPALFMRLHSTGSPPAH